MPDTPLAYFLTFGTYGSWLHGDDRGSKDRKHNTHGEPPRPDNETLRNFERGEMRSPPVKISAAARAVLEISFRRTCETRGWLLLELNIRTEHLHVIVAANDVPPERAMTTLKAHGTRALRLRELCEAHDKFWERHGSTRLLWRDDDVALARDYVLNHQGPDLEGSEWRHWRDFTGENS